MSTKAAISFTSLTPSLTKSRLRITQYSNIRSLGYYYHSTLNGTCRSFQPFQRCVTASSRLHLQLLPSLSRRTMSSSSGNTFYDLKSELPSGQAYDFEQLKGKVVLIVNVASKCGFTPQYKGLQALYDKYKERGFVILGFPCNQFGGQEPGEDAAIASFCELNHGVNFPLMKKSDVNGDNTSPVYQWLKNEKPGLMGLTRIKWNFEKFLVDKNGKVVNRWASTTTPQAIDATVEKLLAE